MSVPFKVLQKSNGLGNSKTWIVSARYLNVGSEKFQQAATAAAADEVETRPSEWDKAKPYSSIPGPKPLPIPYGNFWRFTSFGKRS